MHFLGKRESIKAKLWAHTGVQGTHSHRIAKVLLYV